MLVFHIYRKFKEPMCKTTDQESTYEVTESPLITKICIVMREPLYYLLVLLLMVICLVLGNYLQEIFY